MSSLLLKNVPAQSAAQQVNSFASAVGAASFREDFISCASNGAITTSTTFGCDTAWASAQIVGGTQSIATQDASFNNPGQVIATTSATSGQGVALYKTSAAHAPLGVLNANTGWQLDIIFKLAQITNCAVRIGVFGTGQNVADAPTSGMWIRFDTAASDTNFTFESRNASTSTVSVVNSIAADTNFHHFRIRSVVAGTILFSVDGGTETAISTNVPTTAQMPVWQTIARANGAISAVLDFFGYQASPTRT